GALRARRPLAAGGGGGARARGAGGPHPLPHLPRARGARIGVRARGAGHRAAAGAGAPDLPPAAPLRGGVLLVAAGPQGERAADLAARHRPRRGHGSVGGSGGPLGHRAAVERGVRARRRRLPHRRGRAGHDTAPPGRAAPGHHDRRGREPDQRLDGARLLPFRGARRGPGLFLAVAGGFRVPAHGPRRFPGRPRRGVVDRAGAPAGGRRDGRDHDLPLHGLRRVPAGRGAPALRRDSRRD
ncbi:MAG: Na+/H+ antiporter, partial [uncultured Rubrobacteraceae bacterium]